jgi:hypothetical protein
VPSLRPASEIPEALADVIDDPASATYPPDKTLIVGDLNLSGNLEDWKIEVGDNGAMILTATISGRMNQNYANADVTLWVYIDDHPILAFKGVASRPLLKRSYTELTAYTPLAVADRVPLIVTWGGDSLATAWARSAFRWMHMYSRGQIRIEDLDMMVHIQGDEPMQPNQHISDILDKLRDETRAIFRDVPPAGVEAFLPSTALAKPVWSYSADDTLEDSWAIEGDIDQMYRWVVVWRKDEPDANPPITGYTVWAPVRYQDMPYKPHERLIDWIEVSEDDGIVGPDQAYRLARRTARMYSLQRHEFKATWPYNPYLRFGSAIKVSEDAQDLTGQKWHYEWLALVDRGVTHNSLKSTETTGTLRLISATSIEEPIPALELPSVSVAKTTPIGFTYWGESDIYFFELNTPYLNLAGPPFTSWADNVYALDYLTTPYAQLS